MGVNARTASPATATAVPTLIANRDDQDPTRSTKCSTCFRVSLDSATSQSLCQGFDPSLTWSTIHTPAGRAESPICAGGSPVLCQFSSQCQVRERWPYLAQLPVVGPV